MSEAEQNDRIDWASALENNHRWLHAVVTARVGEQQAVDEVMQEIAAAAVGSKSPPTSADKVSPWLYQVAVRQSLLYRRRAGRDRKKTANFALAARPSEVDFHTPDPLEWLIDSERGLLIREALDRLPRRDREVLLLKYTEDWTYREIARLLGTSESAVESRLHRARKRLRSELVKAELMERT
jgi:RNA polymerase sigma factor (sigma-70 family)